MNLGDLLILLFTWALISPVAAAPPRPTLGNPTFSGQGCDASSVSFALSEDGESLSVLFDNFLVEAGNGTVEEAKRCRISIPIEVPEGRVLGLFKADYRGFNALPEGASSEFLTDFTFEGGPDPKKAKKRAFKGPMNDEFLETINDRARSKCGGPTNLSLGHSLESPDQLQTRSSL